MLFCLNFGLVCIAIYVVMLLSTIDKVGATLIPKRITVELDDMMLADTAPLP